MCPHIFLRHEKDNTDKKAFNKRSKISPKLQENMIFNFDVMTNDFCSIQLQRFYLLSLKLRRRLGP